MPTLGADVWLEIVAFFLDPRDILCLRMTSSMLHQLTVKRSVWIQALRTLCLMKGAPLCSFPFETMSASQAEKYTLRPYRFLANILSPNPSLLQNMQLIDRRDIIDRPLFENPWLEEESALIKGFWTAPGGRYAFTINSEHWMTVWDMGDVANEDFQPILITSLRLPGVPTPGYGFYVLPIDSQSKIRVVLQFLGTSARSHHHAKYVDIDLKTPGALKIPNPEVQDVFSLPPASPFLYIGSSPRTQRLSSVPHGQFAFEVDFEGHHMQVHDLVRDYTGCVKLPGSLSQAFETPLASETGRPLAIEFFVAKDAYSDRALVHMLTICKAEVIVFSYDVRLFASSDDAQRCRTEGAYDVTRLDGPWGDASISAGSVQWGTEHTVLSVFASGPPYRRTLSVLHFPPRPPLPPQSSSVANVTSNNESLNPPLQQTYLTENMPYPIYEASGLMADHLILFSFDGDVLTVSTARLGGMALPTLGSDAYRSSRIAAPVIGPFASERFNSRVTLDIWRGIVYLLEHDAEEKIDIVRALEFAEAV